MSETHETPAERRLREMAAEEQRKIESLPFAKAGQPSPDAAERFTARRDAINAGREALALLRRYKSGELNWMAFDGLMRALLARCEGDR